MIGVDQLTCGFSTCLSFDYRFLVPMLLFQAHIQCVLVYPIAVRMVYASLFLHSIDDGFRLLTKKNPQTILLVISVHFVCCCYVLSFILYLPHWSFAIYKDIYNICGVEFVTNQEYIESHIGSYLLFLVLVCLPSVAKLPEIQWHLY